MNEQTATPDYLTKEEAAALLRLKPDTMNFFARKGRLPSHWIGKRRLFKRADMLAFLDANRHEGGSFPQRHTRRRADGRG